MKRFDVRALRRLAFNMLRILLGTLIAAASFRYLTYPNSIVSGGIRVALVYPFCDQFYSFPMFHAFHKIEQNRVS